MRRLQSRHRCSTALSYLTTIQLALFDEARSMNEVEDS